MGLAFRYPVGWHAARWSDVSSFSALIVVLSTGRQHDPCSVTVGSGDTAVVCGEPVGMLAPGQIVVKWSENGFPAWHPPVTTTAVGGHPASETRAMAGWCAALRGTETITVVISLGADSWYQLDACLRAPGLSQDEAQIAAMLASVRVTAG